MKFRKFTNLIMLSNLLYLIKVHYNYMICQLTIVCISATYCKTCGQMIHYRNTRYIGKWHDFVWGDPE